MRQDLNWKNLDDANDRFEYQTLPQKDSESEKLLSNVRKAIDKTKPPANKGDKDIRERFRSKHSDDIEAILIRDKLTGNRVAIASIYSLGEDITKKIKETTPPDILEKLTSSPSTKEAITETNHEVKAFVIKPNTNDVDMSKVSDNDKEAKKALGLSEDAVLAGGRVKDIHEWKLENGKPIQTILEADSVKQIIDTQSKLHKAPKISFPSTDGPKGIVVHNALMDEHFKNTIPDFQDKTQKLYQMKEKLNDEKYTSQAGDDKVFEIYEKSTELEKELDDVKTNSYKAILNPAHLIRDPNSKNPKLVFSDGVDLTNNWIGLEGDETTPLNDIEGKFSIGKVDPEMITASSNIKEGEKLTGSIRLVNNETGQEYNLFSLEEKSEDPERPNGWMRIDKVVDGKPVASNQEAMDEIGMRMFQVPMGAGESKFTKETISPEGLRRNLSESQFDAHTKAYSNEAGISEVDPDEYVGKTGLADEWGNDAELKATAAGVKAHFNIKQLGEREIGWLEDMYIMPGSNDTNNPYLDFKGTVAAFSITERGANGNDITFGQTVKETKETYHGAIPSTSSTEFYTEIPKSGYKSNVVQGQSSFNTKPEHIRSLEHILKIKRSYMNSVDGSKKEFIGDYPLAHNRRTGENISPRDAYTGTYNKGDVFDALMLQVDNNDTSRKVYSQKNENMFGLGQKHEAYIAVDKSKEATNDSVIEPEVEPEKEIVSTPKHKGLR